jgi:ABC-type phosphate transport system ATPase subunit
VTRSAARIEDVMQETEDLFTIVIVTHNTQRAARVSDRVASQVDDLAGGGAPWPGEPAHLAVEVR